jgi:hypothetical protein
MTPPSYPSPLKGEGIEGKEGSEEYRVAERYLYGGDGIWKAELYRITASTRREF